jgi:hypothetical protein
MSIEKNKDDITLMRQSPPSPYQQFVKVGNDTRVKPNPFAESLLIAAKLSSILWVGPVALQPM